MSRLFALLPGMVLLAYPFVVWWGLHQGELIWLCLALGLLFALRLLPQPVRWREMAALSRLLAGMGLLLCSLSLLCRRADLLLYYPVLVSGSLLALFGWSLWQPMTLVERIARLQEPQLPPAAIRYTRQVTRIWCGFFIFNGAIAIATIWHGDLALWSLYNGLLSYLLMGTLMAGEWLVRQRVRARLVQDGGEELGCQEPEC